MTNIPGLSGREEQEAVKIAEVELIPEGTADSIINKIIWGDKKEYYDRPI